MQAKAKLTDPVIRLRGVGPQMAIRLERLGVRVIQDLLFLLPLKYQDRTRVTPLGSLRSGDDVLVEGEIEHVEVIFRRRRTLLVIISDGTGSLLLRFFYFNQQQQDALIHGVRLRCYGEARRANGRFEMVHPEYRRLFSDTLPVDECLTPVYPGTEGVQQKTLRHLSEQALQILSEESRLPECLPDKVVLDFQYPTLIESLHYVHRPPPDAPLLLLGEGRHPAQQRLAFEELLAHQLSMRLLRQAAQNEPAPMIPLSGKLQEKCAAILPFALTSAQQRVIAELNEDLAKPRPTLRLVQGDVGSGKTIVAVMAALQVIEAGYQVAVMAPTELLSEQHYRNFLIWLEPLGLRVGWLSGRIKGRLRTTLLQQLAEGDLHLTVGTHALFQQDVVFQRLALLIIDEQHRFGVHQRLALREKGVNKGGYPHQITMTATPIPRTLAMTAYADLDYSVIDELPPGRKPVKTVVVSETRRDEVIDRIQQACAKGRQAYWVCTLIEESEILQCQAAEDTAAMLAKILPHLSIGLIHGRLKIAEKEAAMQKFKQGKLQLLVATTVIEVGVDVPNASLMIIENAERLGLAQLHQLRGRVGRGNAFSSCVLIYRPPLSEKARTRLNVMRENQNGFEIASKDLEIRGPGEILGTRQTGLIDFRVADIVRDAELLPPVQKAAALIMKEYPALSEEIVNRWLGGKQQFRQV